MDPTNPQDVVPPAAQQEQLEKSNVQARIDEITKEKYAYQKQVEELTKTVQDMVRVQAEKAALPQAPVVQAPELPDGIDPSVAKYFQYMAEQQKQQTEAIRQQTQQMFWQMQNQMDQQRVASQYSHLPPEVVQNAASKLTALEQHYGKGRVNMEDAIALAHWEHFKKTGQAVAAQRFNQMGQPMTQQSGMPVAPQSTNLVAPSSLPGWDQKPLAQQLKEIDAYEKAGGRLIG